MLTLSRTQALATNFTEAKLTGACIEDWNINKDTKLNDLICDYVFLKARKQERRPSSGNFTPGEFTQLFQKAFETIELIFYNGINFKSFAHSLEKVKVIAGATDLSIQTIRE